MVYAQFYQNSTGYVEGSIPPRFEKQAIKPIEATGSAQYARLDGRKSKPNLRAEAREVCAKRGFIGFEVRKGGFSQYTVVIPFIKVDRTNPAVAP